MDEQNFSVLELERHETKDVSDSHKNGELTVIWRNWDNMIKNKSEYFNTYKMGANVSVLIKSHCSVASTIAGLTEQPSTTSPP